MSRDLTNSPETRQKILDLLFDPNNKEALEIIKNEIIIIQNRQVDKQNKEMLDHFSDYTPEELEQTI